MKQQTDSNKSTLTGYLFLGESILVQILIVFHIFHNEVIQLQCRAACGWGHQKFWLLPTHGWRDCF